MPEPKYFETSRDFRRWLQAHASSEKELLVGFRKIASGLPSLTWPESVDEALCFGWIDGIRRGIDDQSYSIRFTPRKAGSIWSAVNIGKVEQLRAAGRMTPAGETAFARRQEHKSVIYAYEQSRPAELSDRELREFRKQRKAWKFFQATPPGYQKVMLHWVTTAKKAGTRVTRLAKLINASAAGQRLR